MYGGLLIVVVPDPSMNGCAKHAMIMSYAVMRYSLNPVVKHSYATCVQPSSFKGMGKPGTLLTLRGFEPLCVHVLPFARTSYCPRIIPSPISPHFPSSHLERSQSMVTFWVYRHTYRSFYSSVVWLLALAWLCYDLHVQLCVGVDGYVVGGRRLPTHHYSCRCDSASDKFN